MDTTIDKINYLKDRHLSLIKNSLDPDVVERWENDTELYQHSLNTMFLSFALGKEVGLTNDDLELLCLVALLHDIGKLELEMDYRVGRPLTDHEWDQLKNHCFLGSLMLSDVPGLKHIAPYITFHHEYYDGSGYPSGVKGMVLPIEVRIVSIADAFDAMIYKRLYQPVPKSIKEAFEELQSCAGTQFDPKLVEVFRKFIEGNTLSIVRGLMLGGEPHLYDNKVTGRSGL